MGRCNTWIHQAAKDVRESHDTLVDIFERMEMFFRRVEVYTEVEPSAEIMDIIIEIMVQVISIIGIATKDIKESRISKFYLTNLLQLIEGCSGKLGKRLIGKTVIEDALKRLDKLAHEEGRMGIAQNLNATHAVGERVVEMIRGA